MSEEDGVVRVAPEVIVTIVRRTAADAGDGVTVSIDEDDAVTVKVNLIAEAGTNVIDLGNTLQDCLHRAIEELVGMHVMAIDVNVEDVTFASAER